MRAYHLRYRRVRAGGAAREYDYVVKAMNMMDLIGRLASKEIDPGLVSAFDLVMIREVGKFLPLEEEPS